MAFICRKKSVLELYKNCKELYSYENYRNILPKGLRFYITNIRMSTHTLRVQTGIYGQNIIPRSERYCLCCNALDLEDKYNFFDMPMLCWHKEKMWNDIITKDHQGVNLAKYLRESIKIRNTIVRTHNWILIFCYKFIQKIQLSFLYQICLYSA
jgi:hypothetical protein